MNTKLNKFNDRPELEKSDIIKDMPAVCSDELAAVEFFEAQRWGDSPCCPHCNSKEVATLKDRDGNRHKRFLWFCRGCKKQYTVRIGTIYEETRLPLRHWAFAFWRSTTSKKGVSALEIQRQCQISYKSALFLMHRIRFAMTTDDGKFPPLRGMVEVDETYVGGKKKFVGRGSLDGKVPVVSAVERGGRVRSKVVPQVTGKTLKSFVQNTCKANAEIHTDESRSYYLLRPHYAHYAVKHAMGEYARREKDRLITTNTVEGFFSLLKRGITGIYHAVSKEHLHRYLGEFDFRWNNRRLNDGERLVTAIKQAEGKRLLYSEAVAS
jgi:transposase-like protein